MIPVCVGHDTELWQLRLVEAKKETGLGDIKVCLVLGWLVVSGAANKMLSMPQTHKRHVIEW